MQDIQIIYEDDDITAVNKPAGLLVHGVINPKSEIRNPKQIQNIEIQKTETLTDWLIIKYPEIKNVGDEPEFRPGIVHRLDKNTSGVLVVAKNQKAFEFLKKQFQERTTSKKYIALVNGEMKNNQGVIDLPIAKSKNDFRKRASIGKMIGQSREAITEYKVTKRFPKYTLVEVFPKTGRTHQIRVHFKAIGHPIVCDKLYGSKNQVCPFGLTRQFLHANSLELTLPNDSCVKLEADLPEDLERVLVGLAPSEVRGCEARNNMLNYSHYGN